MRTLFMFGNVCTHAHTHTCKYVVKSFLLLICFFATSVNMAYGQSFTECGTPRIY